MQVMAVSGVRGSGVGEGADVEENDEDAGLLV